MKLRTLAFLAGVLFASALFGTVSFGQVSPEEELILEEEFIRSKTEHGLSHASGNRDDLGPVILGNPTQAVVDLRVGIHYSYNAAGNYSEFASLHHPSVRLTNTEGFAYVTDLATGQQIDAITPGQMTFTRMSVLPRHSFARMRAAWTSAAFAPAYGVEPGKSATACMVDTSTMLPRVFAAFIRSAASRASRIGPM